MPSVLLTAFEPYGCWTTNASWLCLVELTRELPAAPAVTTRLYPVDFQSVRPRLAADLAQGYDVVLHLGQAPGSCDVRLEALGINVGREPDDEAFFPLSPAGPAAYASSLPLADWSARLRQAGIPAAVSHHAGTYLCNATLYWSLELIAQSSLPTQAAFIHLPLETSQAASAPTSYPSLPARLAAQALRLLLGQIASPALA